MRDVQEALNISQAAAILLLRDLTEEDILIKAGAAKHLLYLNK